MDNRETEIEDMQSTKKQLLRDPDIEPSSDVIAEALGESNNAYIKFISELASHDIHLEWRYYNDGIYAADCIAQGMPVDKCALYCYRLAVHYADHDGQLPEGKQNWWDWKD